MDKNLEVISYEKVKDTYLNFILISLKFIKNLIKETSDWEQLKIEPAKKRGSYMEI